jgi:dienelactone hydrolase
MARRRWLIGALAAVAIAAALTAGPGRRGAESVLLLRDLGSGSGAAPERKTIEFAVEGRAYAADLYGEGEARSRLLLVPGLAPDGKDDRRLVDLAVVLAGAGFAVLVPDIASLRAQQVSAENVRQIADALVHLATGADATAADAPLGIAAISYAVGPALLATLEPRVAGRVDFMVAIGGYYDVAAVVTYFTTGYYRSDGDGSWVKGRPNEYGKWLFVAANANAVMDLRDRVTLRAIAGRKMDDTGAAIDDLVPLLGAEGRAVFALLANSDPEAVGGLIGGLPERLRANLAALDLKGRDLTQAPASVILIHGRDDRVVPVTESIELAAALPAGRAHLYVVDRLAHADLEPGDWRDVVTSWQAAYRLLRLRDGGG